MSEGSSKDTNTMKTPMVYICGGKKEHLVMCTELFSLLYHVNREKW